MSSKVQTVFEKIERTTAEKKFHEAKTKNLFSELHKANVEFKLKTSSKHS